MSEIQDQVKKIVVDHLGIDESKVVPEAKFIDHLGADSICARCFHLHCQRAFGVRASELTSRRSLTKQAFVNTFHWIVLAINKCPVFENRAGNISRPLFYLHIQNTLQRDS